MRRLAAIDVLRAFAALWVVGFHAYLWTPGVRGHYKGLLIYFLQAGHVGVNLFVVLSGFCIYASVSKHRANGQVTPDWIQFAKRRFVRIYPAYFAALVFATLTVAILVDPGILNPGRFFPQFGLHALLVHNLFPQTILSIDGPFWSLALEAQLYVLMPVFILVLNAKGWKWLLGGSLLMAVVVQAISAHILDRNSVEIWTVWHGGVFARAFEFVCGMFAYHLYTQRKPLTFWLLGCIASLIVFTFGRCILEGNASGVLVDQSFGVGFAAIILLTLRLPVIVFSNPAFRSMEWVGLISYSLYLLHNNALTRYWLPFMQQFDLSPMQELVVNITAFPVILTIVSAGFWRLFEYPVLRPARRDPKPLPA